MSMQKYNFIAKKSHISKFFLRSRLNLFYVMP